MLPPTPRSTESGTVGGSFAPAFSGSAAGGVTVDEDMSQNPRVDISRPSWDEYFLGIAAAVSARADCRRRRVGAVLVANNRIVATGYNGAPSGGPSCLAGECPRGLLDAQTLTPGSSYDTGSGACVALHAEQNCLLYADRSRAEHATIYITHEPCDGCRRMIAGSGVIRAVWPGGVWQVR